MNRTDYTYNIRKNPDNTVSKEVCKAIEDKMKLEFKRDLLIEADGSLIQNRYKG